MSYEKEAISSHVETHFLTLDSYGRMYERKRIQRLEAEKKEEKVKESVGEDVKNEKQEEEDMNHSIEKGAENGLKEKEGTVVGNEKSEAKGDDLDELNKSLAKLAESVVGKKKAEVKIQDLKHQPNDHHRINGNSSKVEKETGHEQVDEIEKVKVTEMVELIEKVNEIEQNAKLEKDVERPPELQRKLSFESPPGKDCKDDVFVYLCPFPACDFSTDFEVVP